MVADKRVQAKSFQRNLQNKPVVRKELFLQTFLNIHVKLFSVPVFCGSFLKKLERNSILFSKPLQEYKNQSLRLEKVLHLQVWLTFKNGYQPQFTQEVSENVAIGSRKLPTYTIKVYRTRSSVVNFIKKC